MNTTVAIKGLSIGSGRPKICLPIVGRTILEIQEQAANIIHNPVDIIEWRVDYFPRWGNRNEIDTALAAIHEITGNIPLLFTIRTTGEGGEADISFDKYKELLTYAASHPLVDAVDVEILISDAAGVKALIKEIKKNKVVIASNHDFEKTPDKKTILDRLKYMEKCGANICKMAVMPQNNTDVLNLLYATEEAKRTIKQPVVTMSMGKMGLISRLSGEIFGSSITFGCVGKASAPGQIEAKELDTVLMLLHENLK